jgi:hypothetical protein
MTWFAKEGCMAEALVEARAVAAIADRAKMAERFNMVLLLEGCAQARWFGSSGYLSDCLAARFTRSWSKSPHATAVHPAFRKFAAAPTMAPAVEAVPPPPASGCCRGSAANNRPLCKQEVLIFSRRRREIAAIGGRAVCPAATFIGGHLG